MNLTLRKIAIWMSKNCPKLDIFFKKNWQKIVIFFKCQVFGIFLTFNWQFSGGSGCHLGAVAGIEGCHIINKSVIVHQYVISHTDHLVSGLSTNRLSIAQTCKCKRSIQLSHLYVLVHTLKYSKFLESSICI